MLGRLITSTFFLLLANTLAYFISKFFHISKDLPLVSTCLGQMGIVFLFCYVAFIKEEIKVMMSMTWHYTFFLVQSFAILTFLPIKYKLFTYPEIPLDGTGTIEWISFYPVPDTVNVNIVAWIIINLVCMLYLLVVPRKLKVNKSTATQSSKEKTQEPVEIEDDLVIQEPQEFESVGEVRRADDDIVNQETLEQIAEDHGPDTIQEIFNAMPETTDSEHEVVVDEVMIPEPAPSSIDTPTEDKPSLKQKEMSIAEQVLAERKAAEQGILTDEQLEQLQSISQEPEPIKNEEEEEENVPPTEEKLSGKELLAKLEQTLLSNIDFKVEEALCMDEQGNTLEDTIFHWHSASPQKLIETFNRYDTFSKNSGTESLCRLAFKDKNDWYMLSKYKSTFLVLKSSHPDPSPLLETTHKVLEAV